jgi:endonuclease IV
MTATDAMTAGTTDAIVIETIGIIENAMNHATDVARTMIGGGSGVGTLFETLETIVDAVNLENDLVQRNTDHLHLPAPFLYLSVNAKPLGGM